MQAGGRRCVFLGLPVPAGSRVDAKLGREECAYGRPVPEDSQVDTLHSADRSVRVRLFAPCCASLACGSGPWSAVWTRGVASVHALQHVDKLPRITQ